MNWKLTRNVFLALALGVAVGASAHAAEVYTIDPVHSSVGFKVRHLASYTTGVFTGFEGTVVFDEEDIANSGVEATIQAASIDTNNEDRDEHLRGEDFFHVEKYPVIKFASKKVVRGADNTFKVTGNLMMHGVTKEVTLDVEYFGKMALSPGKPPRAGFSASAELNRKDYGIVWNKVLDAGGLVLGETVKISIEIEAIMQERKPSVGGGQPRRGGTSHPVVRDHGGHSGHRKSGATGGGKATKDASGRTKRTRR
jgi:polyisoprenoid-binding protein YceI